MPIQGNMSPIMRKADPQEKPMQLPRQEEQRLAKERQEAARPGAARILGSYMTREELLEYIRVKRQEAQAKRENVPPPPPPTERQLRQIEAEQEAGRRRVQFYAEQAKHRPPPLPEDPGTPMPVPEDGEGTADRSFNKKQAKVTTQAL